MQLLNDKTPKYFLFTSTLIVIVGIIMVYSSSYMYAKEHLGSSTYFVMKQILHLIIAAASAFIVSKTKLSFWYKNSYKINLIATFLLLLTFSPFGLEIKGSHRWLSLGVFSLQPGEFVKYTVLLATIKYFEDFKNMTANDRWLFLGNIAFPLAVLILQPDFGTFFITSVIVAFVCFLSDFSRKIFYSLFGVGAIGMGLILVAAPYRVKRLMSFLDPWSDPQNSGFQIIQSYLAFANGHIFGQGVGNSTEKLFYLPEAYNDFILSVLGEEFGFIGVLFVVILYASFIYFGFKLALSVKSKLNSQLIASIVFIIGFQAFLNMGVVLGLLPTKGLNLPFISYGGSSLLANVVAVGIIFSSLRPKSQLYSANEVNKTFSYKA